MRKTRSLMGLAAMLWLVAPAYAGFEAGAAHVASPLGGTVCLAGYSTFCGRATSMEKDPVLATAIAFRNTAGDAFMIVKVTDIGFFAAYKGGEWGIYDVRQKIAMRIAALGGPNIPADHIFIVSDHSHHAPDTIGIWGGASNAFMQAHADRAVDAGVAAWQRLTPATLSVAQVDGPVTKSSYNRPPTNNPDKQFRALFATDASGHRIATLVNYAPHATVLGSNNELATGDWTAWAPQEIETLYGGIGMGTVGALGAMDWNKSGDNPAREAEARQRLRSLIAAATAARQAVTGDELKVQQTFIREPITAPVLYANYAASPLPPEQHLSIDRSVMPPWLSGALMGTFAGTVRLGDVLLSAFPGEPFPELHYALRDCATTPEGTACGGITGAKANFLFGAANDFLGYMLYDPEQFQQSTEEGALYLAGCPEEEVQSGTGMNPDSACPDHFVLMVSPTIGRHVVCTVQNAAASMGFGLGPVNDECPVLTALDGQAAPTEFRPAAVGGSSSSSSSSSGGSTSSSSSSSSGGSSSSSSSSSSGSSSSGAATSSSSSGGSSSSGAISSSSSGTPTPVTASGEQTSTSTQTGSANSGRFGGGAFFALPLLLAALRRGPVGAAHGRDPRCANFGRGHGPLLQRVRFFLRCYTKA